MALDFASIFGGVQSLVGRVGDFFNPGAAITRKLVEEQPQDLAGAWDLGLSFATEQMDTGAALIGAAALGGAGSLIGQSNSVDDGSYYGIDGSGDDGSY